MIPSARFLSQDSAESLACGHGTPLYVYSERELRRAAQSCLEMPHAFGLTVRYAMKALPTAAILQLFDELGLHFDASSMPEVERALAAGIEPGKISLSAQELRAGVGELMARGVHINACSLGQLELLGREQPGQTIGLRVNPGLGSGSTQRTNTGGPTASFGIWHAYVDEALSRAARLGLTIDTVHSHIGSGTDPDVWARAADLTIAVAAKIPTVTRVDLGGGFKVARLATETATDLRAVGTALERIFRRFAEEHGRELRLEIEPGTYLVANAGALLAQVIDVVDTGADGHRFLKLDTGMNDILRPSHYGARHPIVTFPRNPTGRTAEYLVAGHNCESGDILTPRQDDPEGLEARTLPETAAGDLAVIDGAGAYCAAMSAKHYNSFPEVAEVLLHEDGSHTVIRAREPLEDLWRHEQPLRAPSLTPSN